MPSIALYVPDGGFVDDKYKKLKNDGDSRTDWSHANKRQEAVKSINKISSRRISTINIEGSDQKLTQMNRSTDVIKLIGSRSVRVMLSCTDV
jgi:hypothetical protein